MTVEDILQKARAKGLMIVAVESCTGGMVAAALTDIPGSSNVVERGYVTYSNNSKIQEVNVKPETLEAYGAVSEQVAREMAEGGLRNSAADIAVSVTGIAGPGGSEHKPEGRVCFGLAVKSGPSVTETVEFGPQGRDKVRALSRDHALQLLERTLS